MLLRRSSRSFMLIAGMACAGTFAHAGSTLFRVDDLDLRDPHVFINFISCMDATDSGFPGFSVNGSLQDRIQGDTDPADGYLDLSYVLEFRPLDQSAGINAMTFGNAQCTAPRATSACAPISNPVDTTATLSGATECLAPLPDTLHPYTPNVTAAPAPCFSSSPATFEFVLAGTPVVLHDMQLAATFDNAPATGLLSGVIRGFLTEEDANNTVIPASYPVIGGQKFSSLLAGGTGACPMFSDKDLNASTPGWWFYFNFVANAVASDVIFADAFE